jgi:hypothetical protein
MSKRTRLICAASGLIALFCSSLSAQDSKVHNGGGAPKTNTAPNKSGNFCGASFTMDCGRDDVGPDKYYEDRNTREDLDLKAQQSVADSTEKILRLTKLQMGVSVVGLGLLFWSLRQTRTAIKDTREIGEAQVRAYMSLSDINLNWGPETFREFTPEFKWKNTGQSPALKCIVYTDFHIQEFDSDDVLVTSFSERPTSSKVGVFCAAGADFNAPGSNIAKYEAVDFYSKKRRLVIFSAITYEDVFGEKHLVEACSVAVFPHDAEPDKIGFRTYGHHNGYQKIKD